MNADNADEKTLDLDALRRELAALEEQSERALRRLDQLIGLPAPTPTEQREREEIEKHFNESSADPRQDELWARVRGLNLVQEALSDPDKLAERVRAAGRKGGVTKPLGRMTRQEFEDALGPLFRVVVLACGRESPPPWARAIMDDPTEAAKMLRELVKAFVAFTGDSQHARDALAQIGVIEDGEIIRAMTTCKRNRLTLAEARRVYLAAEGLSHLSRAGADRYCQRVHGRAPTGS